MTGSVRNRTVAGCRRRASGRRPSRRSGVGAAGAQLVAVVAARRPAGGARRTTPAATTPPRARDQELPAPHPRTVRRWPGRHDHAGRGARRPPTRLTCGCSVGEARRPRRPRRHQRAGEPRGHGRRHRRPAAAAVAHRARTVDGGLWTGDPPPRRPAQPARGGLPRMDRASTGSGPTSASSRAR